MPLENAIIETLAYSDIFDYPLTIDELYRFLGIPASHQDIEQCAVMMKTVSLNNGYYSLAGRGGIVEVRKYRASASRRIYNRAMFYGRFLGAMPFVRMVALTGSLAMLNLSRNPDMDFMLVAKHGRVWTARAFAIVLGRIARLFGDTICPNVIVSECALEWPLHDLYSARELCQMIPVTGLDFYLRLFDANLWIKSFLPNANPKTSESPSKTSEFFRSTLWVKNSEAWKVWNKFESWEMNRKIARFSKQEGFGAETVFTADVCQGNFHHHREWTHDVYQERLFALGFPLPAGEGRRRTDGSTLAHRPEVMSVE